MTGVKDLTLHHIGLEWKFATGQWWTPPDGPYSTTEISLKSAELSETDWEDMLPHKVRILLPDGSSVMSLLDSDPSVKAQLEEPIESLKQRSLSNCDFPVETPGKLLYTSYKGIPLNGPGQEQTIDTTFTIQVSTSTHTLL